MYIACIMNRVAGSGKFVPYGAPIVSKTATETLEEVAARADIAAETYRKQANGYEYTVWCGELTHEIEPPKPKPVKVKLLEKKG